MMLQDTSHAVAHTSTGAGFEHHQPGREPRELRVTGATYYRPDSARPATIFVELDVDRVPAAANTARMNAAHDRLDGGAHHIDSSIDGIASRKLQERSGTTATVSDGGYTIGIAVNISAAGTAPDAGRPLTAVQEAQLPDLVRAIGSCLPATEQRDTQALALLAAQQIPTRKDVIETFDQLTLAEIINHHDKRMETYAQALLPPDTDVRRDAASLQPALQAYSAVRLAQLSFPQHPTAALQPPHNAPAANGSRTFSAQRSGPSIDR